MPRSFASLTPQEALQVAISIEQRNAEVYLRFAAMFAEFGDDESQQIATVFGEMAAEETGHHAMLEQKYTEQYGSSPRTLTEDEIGDLIEVPRLEGTDLLSAGRGGRNRALQVALWAEIGAQSYYEDLVKLTPEGPLRDTYSQLATMELDHVAFLEAKLAKDGAATK